MKKKTILSLLIAMVFIQLTSARNPTHTSSWDFTGEINLELDFRTPKWYAPKERALNASIEHLEYESISGIEKVPFVSSSAKSRLHHHITIPIKIHLQDVKIHQYKDGVFTFFIEDYPSFLDDHLDIHLRMPFIGSFYKDKAHILCKEIKLDLFIGGQQLKVRSNAIHGQALLDHSIDIPKPKTKKNIPILAQNVSLITEDIQYAPLMTTATVGLIKGSYLPFYTPDIAEAKIYFKQWTLKLVPSDHLEVKESHENKSKNQEEIIIVE